MNAKISPYRNHGTGDLCGYSFECPGCQEEHYIPTVGPKAWGFNGSLERPTFTPSILVRGTRLKDDSLGVEGGKRDFCCHSFVTDGRIQFLGDCTHALAGQTVELRAVSAT